MNNRQPVTSCGIVILGASGDLARRKLIPALDRLYQKGLLAPSCAVVGCGRTPFTTESFRQRFTVSPGFASLLSYHTGIAGLREHLRERNACGRVVVFMALPPATYAATAGELAGEGLNDRASIIIEKPFGYNRASAAELDRELSRHFDEGRIYRIDHYLAKEAVQNILVFRFANALFEPVWNSRHIECIQINAQETVGVEDRGAYFDRAGVIRDMVQNHLMQLLCLLTMEPPVSLAADDIRARKIDVLRCMGIAECYRQQYEGYRSERGVAPDSTTETYAELKMYINNLRWAGTPVFIRTGKGTNRKGTEIGVRLRPLPPVLFNEGQALAPNRIVFKIQPDEGIIVDLVSKAPGADTMLAGTHMNFCYRQEFDTEIPEAYQRLLLDALRQDHTLFVSAAESEASWRIFDPFLDLGDVGRYPRGTLPASRLDVEWIDFEAYTSFCA